MAEILKLIGGAAAVAGGIAIDAAGLALATAGGASLSLVPIGNVLIAAGAGQVISGVGSMIAGGPKVSGLATTTRESAAPWNMGYGRVRTGGRVLYASSVRARLSEKGVSLNVATLGRIRAA
jgi:hypothetical protein